MTITTQPRQLPRYSSEKNADRLWALIKENMAADTEELKARLLNELTNLKMKKEESIDAYINRTEALRNQCVQLEKSIEDFELKMYILRGLREDYDSNVRVLEIQKNLTTNDIRFALKQEEIKRETRKEERSRRDQESMRKVRDASKNDIHCFNCRKKGHVANEYYKSKRCFNYQGFNHVAANCKEPKKNVTAVGRGRRGNFQRGPRGRSSGQTYGRDEVSLRTTDEAVLKANDISQEEAIYEASEKELEGGADNNCCTWLLDSGSTSHMTHDKLICNKLFHEKKDIILADKKGKKLTSENVGEVILKQASSEKKVRLEKVLCVPDLNTNLLSVAKITDHGYNVKYNKFGAVVYKEPEKVEMTAVRVDNAYHVRTFVEKEEAVAISVDDLWHKKLGHANK